MDRWLRWITLGVVALLVTSCAGDVSTAPPATSALAPTTTTTTATTSISTTTTTQPPATTSTATSTMEPRSRSCLSTRNRVYKPTEWHGGALPLGSLPVEPVDHDDGPVGGFDVDFAFVAGEFVDCEMEIVLFMGEMQEVPVFTFYFGNDVYGRLMVGPLSYGIYVYAAGHPYLYFDETVPAGRSAASHRWGSVEDLIDSLFLGERYAMSILVEFSQGTDSEQPPSGCEDEVACREILLRMGPMVEENAALLEAMDRGEPFVGFAVLGELYAREPDFIYEAPDPVPGITVFVEPDCPRCEQVVDLLGRTSGGVPVQVLEVTYDLAGEYNITALPTVIIFGPDGQLLPGKYDDTSSLSQPIHAPTIAQRACEAFGGTYGGGVTPECVIEGA